MFNLCSDLMHLKAWQEWVICGVCHAPVDNGMMRDTFQPSSKKVPILLKQIHDLERQINQARTCSHCTQSGVDTYCVDCLNAIHEGKLKMPILISQDEIDATKIVKEKDNGASDVPKA